MPFGFKQAPFLLLVTKPPRETFPEKTHGERRPCYLFSIQTTFVNKTTSQLNSNYLFLSSSTFLLLQLFLILSLFSSSFDSFEILNVPLPLWFCIFLSLFFSSFFFLALVPHSCHPLSHRFTSTISAKTIKISVYGML